MHKKYSAIPVDTSDSVTSFRSLKIQSSEENMKCIERSTLQNKDIKKNGRNDIYIYMIKYIYTYVYCVSN